LLGGGLDRREALAEALRVRRPQLALGLQVIPGAAQLRLGALEPGAQLTRLLLGGDELAPQLHARGRGRRRAVQPALAGLGLARLADLQPLAAERARAGARLGQLDGDVRTELELGGV